MTGPAVITEYSATTVIPPGKKLLDGWAENLVIQVKDKDRPTGVWPGRDTWLSTATPSFFFGFFLFFDRHILQFAGLEDVATFLAFDIFRVFVARDDLHSWVLALLGADFIWWGGDG